MRHEAEQKMRLRHLARSWQRLQSVSLDTYLLNILPLCRPALPNRLSRLPLGQIYSSLSSS
jgi:hypothetical protein